jgi:hypothetical protein
MLWYRERLVRYMGGCNRTSLVLGLGPIPASTDGSTLPRRPGETSSFRHWLSLLSLWGGVSVVQTGQVEALMRDLDRAKAPVGDGAARYDAVLWLWKGVY